MIENIDKLIAIEYMKRTYSFNMKSDHFHDAFEIYYLLAGERNYYINNHIYTLKKGDLIFINKYDLHRTTVKNALTHERILLHFHEEFLITNHTEATIAPQERIIQNESFLLRPSIREQELIENKLFAIIAETNDQKPQYVTYLQSLLIQLLIDIKRMKDMGHNQIDRKRNEKQQKAYEILDYINEGYTQRLTLQEISEHLFMNTTYICRIFKQSTGFSVIEYINHLRIKQAQVLLSGTNLKVTEVAERSGFDSIAHFGRVFKQIVKTSPLQFRKRAKLKVE
jgi:AraC-like DNA-binding protein